MCFRNTTIYLRIDITVQKVFFYRAVHLEHQHEQCSFFVFVFLKKRRQSLSLLALFTRNDTKHHYDSITLSSQSIQLILFFYLSVSEFPMFITILLQDESMNFLDKSSAIIFQMY